MRQGLRPQLSRRTLDLLTNGWQELGLKVDDARRRFAELTNQALATFFQAKGLKSHEMASRQLAWWVPVTGPQTRISFKWPQYSGSRQIQGVSGKRNIRWHFGVSTAFRNREPLIMIHSFRDTADDAAFRAAPVPEEPGC